MFLDKNRDSMRADIIEHLYKSSLPVGYEESTV